MFISKSFLVVVVTVVVAGCWAAPSSWDNTRIVNGTEAGDGEFPFIVSIRVANTGQHNCGGSIISPDYILTAAHCALSHPSSYSVQYGTNKISASGSNVVSVSKVVPHERFNPFVSTEFDIAVMKLSRPLSFSDKVTPTVLPHPNQQTSAGLVATIVGWGLDETGGHIQTSLMKVDLFVAEQQICTAVHNITVYPSNICVYYPDGGKGQCSGDSGGPVLVDGVQVGLVSWSLKPCGGVYPSVLTRVASYIDWIVANTDIYPSSFSPN